MAGAALAGGAGVAVTWVVARSLGPHQAGAFFAATAAFVLAGGLAKLGTQTGLVYWPARLRATGRAHLLGACLRAGLVPVAVLSVVLAAGMWLAAPAIARVTAHDAAAVVDAHTVALRVLAVLRAVAGADRRAAHRDPGLPGDAADGAARPGAAQRPAGAADRRGRAGGVADGRIAAALRARLGGAVSAR